MEAYITAVALVLWSIGLWAGIIWARKHWGPWYAIPHGMSMLILIGLLATLTHWLGWTVETVGWWILAVIPAAVVINLLLIVLAGNLWPYCRECSTKMVITQAEISHGSDGPGKATKVQCPECGHYWWRG